MRLQVLGRLELGRSVGLEVPAAADGHRAFIFIDPVVDPTRGQVTVSDPMVEPQVRRVLPNADVIDRYRVTRRELRPGWENVPDDWDLYLVAEVKDEFKSLEALENALHDRWGIQLEWFKHPGEVDHPF